MIIAVVVLFTIMTIMSDMTSTTPVTEQVVTYDSYIDVDGNVVSLDNYQGDYVWVDYAAEWCSYCEPQTRTIKALDRKMGDQVLFLTVVSGTNKVMEPPTAEHARRWAERFNLDPESVLAKFSTDTLPYHLLYSPSGEILYQGSGLYNANKITGIINQYIQD